MRNEIPAGASTAGVTSRYTIIDFDRKSSLLWLLIAFAVLVVLFGRLRRLLSLIGLVIVLVFVVPAILRDSPPLAGSLLHINKNKSYISF